MSELPPHMDSIHRLGLAIREQVREAELERAGQLAAQRHRQLVAMFTELPEADGSEALVDQLRRTIEDDRHLMQELAELRTRLEDDLFTVRRSSRSARAYTEAAAGTD
jgi:hypothetical protein